MKICFIIPPARKTDKVPERVYGCTFTYYKQPELPMLYVAAVLEKDGHLVELKDFTGRNSWDEFSGFVEGADYDIYIFHTVLLAESVDIKAAGYILENTTARVIFFGPHPTLKPREFLLDERCFIARGEAEFVIRDLVGALEEGRTVDGLGDINGIAYLKDGRMVETASYGIIEDLDSLPHPARHLVEDRKDEYFNPKLTERPVTLVLTSRGCSFKCYYCVPNAISWARELEWRRFHGGKKPPVRFRSPNDIVEEFREVKFHGYRAVSVVDDLFLFGGKNRILEICGGLKGVGLPFGVLARCDMVLDEELVKALKDAGCRYVDMGIESLDQKVLDDIKKGMDVSTVGKSIELLNKYGIEPKANIMFGSSPVETTESVESTIEGISGLPINYSMFSIATPFPGTEFAERVKSGGWETPEVENLEENLSPTEKSLVSYPNLSKQALERAVKRANRRFYLNPKRLWHQIKKVNSLRALKDIVLTGWRVVK
jgi:radical SAM superfamily enzyme YgiQ (UPF0313 family)